MIADPANMIEAMREAAFDDVRVEEIEAEWKGPARSGYLKEVRELHSFMPAYAALDADERISVDDAILTIVDKQ